jgi:hypothetical protein
MMREDKSTKVNYDLLLPLNIPYDKTYLYLAAKNISDGAKVHGERNWEKGDITNLASFRASLFRHTMQFLSGETDENHAGAMFFNTNGIVTIMAKYNCDIYGNIKRNTK